MLNLVSPFMILFSLIKISFSSTPNPLSGQHLRVIWTRWSGNPKGLSGPLKGGVILEYLSARFNFTYEMVRVTENWMEPPPNGRGLFSYLWDHQCDLLLQETIPTVQRNKMVDMTVIWNFANFAFLIPVSYETANINAVAKPFQWPVWLGLGISIICVISVLNLMQRYLEYRSTLDKISNENLTSNGGAEGRQVKKELGGKQFLYVFGNLLSQGGPCTSKRLPFRTVAGVWTLAAFIIVQAYTSTLFTYVVAPVEKSLINSIYDVAENTDIKLFIKKDGTADKTISDKNNTGMLLKLRERLDSNPNSRCTFVSDCIRQVTPESRNVFMDSIFYHKDAIKQDYEKTKKCNLKIARDLYMTLPSTFSLPKHSPYTSSISKGLLEMTEIGLFEYWEILFRPMPGKCKRNFKTGSRSNTPTDNKPKSLTLKNLTGAFIVLLGGLSLSLLAFLGEKIFSLSSEIDRRRSNKVQQVQ